MEKIRCIFMGTPQIAATVLESMLKAGISVDLVVSQPDRKMNRKHKIIYSPVKQVALENDIPCFQPEHIKTEYQTILEYQPDVIVTCAYGQIVPEVILKAPKYGCVNLHGSLLPAYRGGAPIQRAIWNGETISGMSLMKMAKGLDSGPVLATYKIDIEESDNSTTLFEKMADAASQLIVDKFSLVCSQEAVYVEQDSEKVTYAPVILKEEEHIDFSKSDKEIVNQIRALALKPGAFGFVNNKKLKVLEVLYKLGSSTTCGEILGLMENKYAISLHEGVLLVSSLQMEGKPVMEAKAFYNGQGRNLVGKIVE